MDKRKVAKFIGQSYLSVGRYGFRFISAWDKHFTRKASREIYKVFKPIYRNDE